MIKNKINIGFVLNYEYESWIGGFNYHLNLFKSLRFFNDKIKIKVFVNNNISKKTQLLLKDYEITKTDYFNNSLIKNRLKLIFSKLKILIFGKDKLLEEFLKNNQIDVLSHSIYLGKNSNFVSVPIIYDFQEIYNKKNFSLKEIILRKISHIMMSIHADKVILSGKHALHDYKKILKKNKTNGVVISQPYIMDFNFKKLKNIKKKYKIKKKYFLMPNQYWRHKNHIIVLKALKHLYSNKNFNFNVISTGNTYNWRDPSYFSYIKNFVRLNNLNNFKILGAIEHDDLLSLAYHSLGIINPSLSEGWSNSVELAKSLNKLKLLSNIKCHKEQSDNNTYFFNTNDHKKLAYLLTKKINLKKKNIFYLKKRNYKFSKNYGNKYYDTIKKAIKEKNKLITIV